MKKNLKLTHLSVILIDKWPHWMTGSANVDVKFGIFTLQKQPFSQTWIAMFLGPTLFSAALLETSGQLRLPLRVSEPPHSGGASPPPPPAVCQDGL